MYIVNLNIPHYANHSTYRMEFGWVPLMNDATRLNLELRIYMRRRIILNGCSVLIVIQLELLRSAVALRPAKWKSKNVRQ